MDALNGRLYYEVTGSSGKRCDSSSVRQIVQNGTLCGNNRRNISGGIGKVIQRQHIEVARITREYCIGSGTSICSGFDERVEQDAGNKDKVINSIPLTNRWANRTYESGVGAVFEVFCGE